MNTTQPLHPRTKTLLSNLARLLRGIANELDGWLKAMEAESKQ